MEKQKAPEVEHKNLTGSGTASGNDVHYRAGLHLVYKKLGETPLEAINRFKLDNPKYSTVPMTYAGRLDPMAEGLLLLLSGDEVHNKEEYNALPKTYEVEILWGWQTDTLDVLGIVESHKVHNVYKVDIDKIEEMLKKAVGKFIQKYPAYSSKPVQGKPLFVWAREGKLDEIEIPSHEVEIFNSNFLKRRMVTGEGLLENIEQKVSLVTGDFRQVEIMNKWRGGLSARLEDKFYVDSVELEVSSGFYVRQFVSDLAQKFGTTAVAFHIKRTRVGDLELANIQK